MVPFGKDYLYIDGEVYKKLKPDTTRKTPRWFLTDKNGKRHWISKSKLDQIIAKKRQT